MADWRALRVEGLGPVSREVAVFQVGPPLARLPFASFKVKIIERDNQSFLAIPNVARRLPDGSPDWTAGLGNSIDEALEDALRYFAESIGDGSDSLEDYEWAAVEDF